MAADPFLLSWACFFCKGTLFGRCKQKNKYHASFQYKGCPWGSSPHRPQLWNAVAVVNTFVSSGVRVSHASGCLCEVQSDSAWTRLFCSIVLSTENSVSVIKCKGGNLWRPVIDSKFFSNGLNWIWTPPPSYLHMLTETNPLLGTYLKRSERWTCPDCKSCLSIL